MTALVSQLEELLRSREIAAAFVLADAHLAGPSAIDRGDPAAISLVLCCAQLNDLGYRDLDWLEAMMSALPARNPELSFLNMMKLNLVEAFHALALEQQVESIEILAKTLLCGEESLPCGLRFVAHFWKGRAHRQKGEYADALKHICTAQAIAKDAGTPRMVAVTKIHESWLVFQAGERRKAFELLSEAEVELKAVGHALSLGNIESARGRFVRRSGDYGGALKHFENAIALYGPQFPNHPNLARALVNAAYVKRLMALDLKPSLAVNAARRVSNAQYLQLTREALDMLRRAAELYSRSRHQGGLGSTLVNAGHLHLECGDFEKAASEADEAYTFASARGDQILLARTRNLQSAIERARAEEQMGEPGDPVMHARHAVRYADEAIEYATHTQNKRLLAESYIARAFAAMDESIRDVPLAEQYAAKAGQLLQSEDRDHLYKELAELKSLLMRGGDIDETLRRWSKGELGSKSFTQVQEEFAEMVIPKVWDSSGRNVAEVARKLAMSPKKVRRILRNAGCKA